MTEPDPSTPVVAPVCIPITSTLYRTLEESWDPMGPRPAMQWLMQIGGHRVRGVWVVVGLRADYAIAGGRTFWATLEWRDDHGEHR